MGAADERLQGTGRGDCESGIDLWLSEEVRAENCSDFSHIVQSCGRTVHKFYGIIWIRKVSNKSEFDEVIGWKLIQFVEAWNLPKIWKNAYDLEISKDIRYNILQCVYCEDNIVPTEDELLKLEDAHYRKIDLSDGIYVVNMDGYIGTSVKKEIEYAEGHGKEVVYHYNQ